MKNTLHNVGATKNFENARLHRKRPTEAEAVLWEIIRGRKLQGYKFRRQHPIQDYIADFYCHELALIVELDGRYHYTQDQKALDEERDRMLQQKRINIIRITNEELLFNTDQCLQTITDKIAAIKNKKGPQ